MSFCKICQEEINSDSQYINGYWYHNNCIENLQENYEKIYNENCKLKEENTKLINQQKDFISYLENEKDKLARENSQIYEDSLGKTRFVNEDIFNEVDKILSKYKKIIGGKNERRITKNNK